MPLTRAEKTLYHQIHPLKLAVDVGTSVASTTLLWFHHWPLAAAVGLLPSFAITALLFRFADLERLRDSAFGRYVAFHMKAAATATRASGQIVIWLAAWWHLGWLIAVGAALIVLGWTWSLPRHLK